MRKTKCWQIILGIFALLGISWTGTQFRNKNLSRSQKKNIAGKWKISLADCPIEKELTIHPTGEVFIDSREIKGEIVRSSKNYFLFQDHFGYRLELFRNKDGELTFFDEADDKWYQVDEI